MSIQWTFIAGYLCYAIIVVMILISPIFGPKNYKNLFQFWLIITFKVYQTRVYFLSLLGILSILLFNSMREMYKFSDSNNPGHTHLSTDLKGSVELLKAQRNFYITVFNIFLTFVIHRMITMFMKHYGLQFKAEEFIKETKDTVKRAKTGVSEAEQVLEVHKLTEHKLKELKEIAAKLDKISGKVVGQGDNNNIVHTNTQ